MKIIEATYGGQDCIKALESKQGKNGLRIKVNNAIIGDPHRGHLKYLKVKWESEGKVYSGSWEEGDFCVIKDKSLKRLGIFYSNNTKQETQKTIIESLKNIEIAAEGKADVLTCMWTHQDLNPFQEYISWTKEYSHLNQLLQIMQLLYLARETGDYESVSFLEHDVLYPEDYFDYPTPSKGELICNMNYIGMNSNGFQYRNQDDQPFHQMSARFEDAISHCEKILPNALITNGGIIEPDLKRTDWRSKNPSVHVNHGHHFTSHCNIYSTETKETNSYWGHISKYKHLFND